VKIKRELAGQEKERRKEKRKKEKVGVILVSRQAQAEPRVDPERGQNRE